MRSRRTSIVLFCVVAGLLALPMVGLPSGRVDRSAFPDSYGLDSPALAVSLLATDTPTVTLTATATSTPTETPGATATATSTPTPSATPTATASATATATATATPAAGRIAGKVAVQGRYNAQGVQILVDGTPAATTAPDGVFETSDVAPGTHVVRATLPGYLPAQKSDVIVNAGQVTTLAPVQLRGGDVDGDNAVGLLDLVIVASNYQTTPLGDPRADINADGRVDLFDLVLVASNYRQAGPSTWP